MAIVKKYRAEIVSIETSIDGVYRLEFKSLGKPFKYNAGQFLHLAIDEYDPSAQWPDSRCFSMQSAPSDENIRITYAVKGQFTKRMQQELKPGKQATLKLPYGDLFSQEHNKKKTVFIAGGTGITPYLSLFTDASFAAYTKPILYAGFRDKNMNLYKLELEFAQKINCGLEIHLVYQETEGVLDIYKIQTENGKDASYFISGPPTMIKIFKHTLIAKGVSEQNVLTDDWE